MAYWISRRCGRRTPSSSGLRWGRRSSNEKRHGRGGAGFPPARLACPACPDLPCYNYPFESPKGLRVMRRLAVAVPAALLVSAMSVFAQAPAAPPAGQQPAQPKPTAPAQPAPKPTPTPVPAPPPSPPKPFPQGAKVAFVNLQAVFQLSADGKA